MDEKEYRLKVKESYARVMRAFDGVDPDVVEAEEGLGTVTLLTKRGKIILSTQPSVSQLWLAAATLGKAVHFNWDSGRATWVDDKGGGLELYSHLSELVEKSAGLSVKI